VQHVSLVDYIAVSADLTDRVIEYVDHLHEHFRCPVVMQGGCYMPPNEPGYSAELLPESIEAHRFPTGSIWAA
jgi:L-fuconate dehydratase